MSTGNQIMALTAGLFNDPSQVTYTNEKLLPMLQLAMEDLQLKLAKAGSQILLDTSAESVLAANDKEMDPPDDLLSPIIVEERNVGSEQEADWVEITQKRVLPNLDPGPNLYYYAWNEQVFKFLGATQAREVRIKYWRNLDAVASGAQNINLLNCKMFLVFKTGAFYCLFPGGQPKKGEDLSNQADKYWNDALTIEVKTQQGMPANRKPYGYSRRMWGRIRGAI